MPSRTTLALGGLLGLLALGFVPGRAEPPATEKFPAELVKFVPAGKEPVFAAAGKGAWDAAIRERGWIMREDGVYKLWYTGAGT